MIDYNIGGTQKYVSTLSKSADFMHRRLKPRNHRKPHPSTLIRINYVNSQSGYHYSSACSIIRVRLNPTPVNGPSWPAGAISNELILEGMCGG